jgi:hypothetical protein
MFVSILRCWPVVEDVEGNRSRPFQSIDEDQSQGVCGGGRTGPKDDGCLPKLSSGWADSPGQVDGWDS